MARRKPTSLGVDWHLPDGRGSFRARRFATTTRATSDLIEALAADGHTVASARDAVNFDPDAKAVLATIAEAGFGDQRLDLYVRT